MYEKPELARVGAVAGVVLGPQGIDDDNELADHLQPVDGIVAGLDD